MKLEIISPEKALFSGDVESVTLPGIAGKFTILPGHAPIISILKEGILVYQVDKQKVELPVKGGFVEMKGDTVNVCVD